jgi:hypothetical protein
MALSTVVSGWALLNKDTESRFGLMELDMKEIGAKIRRADKENSGTLMATCSKESGLMIKPKGMEFIHMLMVLNMRATGKQIYSMAEAKNYGLISLSTKAIIN